ncbi:hypothetical protein KKA27_02065 [Patescibacteria group bacterium]|nr:hypothetical protein [Patescibacteria group bacterium]
MINLLPTQDKKLLKKEFLRRFIVVLGSCFLMLVLTQIILLLSLLFYLVSSEKNLNDQIASTGNLVELKAIDKLEAETKEINDLLSSLQKTQERTPLFSDSISEILKILPPSVRISSFLFEKGPSKSNIVMGGESTTRDDLLIFVEDLKSNVYFKEVAIPVSSLLAEKEVDFSIAVELR